MKTKYQVIVGNVGTMDYTNKHLANDCYTTYVTMSKQHITRAAGESVTLLRNGEIVRGHIGTVDQN